MNTTTTDRQTRVDAVVDELRLGLALECATCTGLICLDCAQSIEHERCTRPCADCAGSDHDAAQLWKTDALLTELHGLARVDEAIAALPADVSAD